MLGVAGRLALGVFAALVYLVLRGFWFLHRDREDDLPDDFLYTRTAPICGAAAFALLPYAWRAGQFLSPGFALLVLIQLGLFLWFCGRGGAAVRLVRVRVGRVDRYARAERAGPVRRGRRGARGGGREARARVRVARTTVP